MIILDAISTAVQRKHIKMTAWRKQVNFIHPSWYGVACHLKDQGGIKIINATINGDFYMKILDHFGLLILEPAIPDDNLSCHKAKESKVCLR